MAKFTQVLSMPNQNKTPCSMNLEQTRKSSLRFSWRLFGSYSSSWIHEQLQSSLLHRNDRASPGRSSDYEQRKEFVQVTPTLQMSVIHRQTPIGTRSLRTSPVFNIDVFCMDYFQIFKPTHRSFVVLKSLADLWTVFLQMC